MELASLLYCDTIYIICIEDGFGNLPLVLISIYDGAFTDLQNVRESEGVYFTGLCSQIFIRIEQDVNPHVKA